MGSRANRVRSEREARGLSQLALARAALLTRQSVNAIEGGRSTPSVDVALRLARALGARVEDLFGGASSEPELSTEAVAPSHTGRVALAHIGERWLSIPLEGDDAERSADALVVRGRARHLTVEPLRPLEQARDNVLLMGCAPALGLLADRLDARRGVGRFLWLARSSTTSLEALARGHTHLAGVHLCDGKTGEANLPDVRRHVRGAAVAVVTLARWEAGLVLSPGNPRRVAGAADLGQKRLRLVGTEPGSGARRLLERELARAGVPPSVAEGGGVTAVGPLAVARAVALGAADAGVATRDAALAFGLPFVPLAEERYDVVVRLEALGDRRLGRMFDEMSSGAFRRELASLGYDAEPCGTRVAELGVAAAP